ncbi:MAG TPA: potassium channel family protein, partial [bacterium]|nr:potassium channel family protein [bacterium]
MLSPFLGILSLVFLLVSIGTAGYMIIEHWSLLDALYMSTITLATVGFMEVHPLSRAGRIFTIFLIAFGIIVLTIILSHVTNLILQGEVGKILRRKKMEKKIHSMKNHCIVCGLGETGKTILEEFEKMKMASVGIDKSSEIIQHLSEISPHLVLLAGDATDDNTLIEAGIEKAKVLLLSLGTDLENLYAIISAKNINPSVRIIAKANEESAQAKMKKAGCSYVISPNNIGGLRMASVAIRPDVVSFLDVMMRDVQESWRIEQAAVPENSPFIGKSLREA